jgi:hypothetical protein
LCSKLIVRLRNYNYEETLLYFLIAVGLISQNALPYVPMTSKCKVSKRMTDERNIVLTDYTLFRTITTVWLFSLVFERSMLKIPVFRGVTLYRPLYRYKCFQEACCLHLQGSPKLETAAESSSETLRSLDKPTGRHSQED